jgi:hypothetical protein
VHDGNNKTLEVEVDGDALVTTARATKGRDVSPAARRAASTRE